MPLTIRDAVPSDLETCTALLAGRHRRDLQRVPFFNPALAEPAACLALLEPLFANTYADGLVAETDGQTVGFLFGERMLLAPTDFASNFVAPHSIAVPVEGHAVAAGEDALSVYRALYAELAGRWVQDGFFIHRVAVTAEDPEVQDAWVTLGFGRALTAAVRATAEPVNVSRSRQLRIEQASPEDIDDVMMLIDEQDAWHWRSPMFWPVVHEAGPAARAFNHNALRSSEIPYFVAYEEGRAIAMQTFLRPGFTPPFVDPASNVYLFEGVVASHARGGGIGGTLLKHSMEWAARSGFETCTLHFASANPLGAPFWQGHGFRPIEHAMQRIIDDRVIWARPRG